MSNAASDGLPSADGKTRVGNYEILSKIGESATGTVFKARQRSMDRIVALKLLKPRLATDKEFVERFRRDVRAAAQLNHPNIVRAYDTGYAGGYFYFAMEYVDGHDLRTVLLASVTLEGTRALGVALDVAHALECVHQVDAIHGDVRPGNILITPNGTAKLAGMGFEHNVNDPDARSTRAGREMGVPNYVSPERARGDADIDSRTDIYSLGATLYHMLTGAPPYLGGSNAEVMSMHLTLPVPDARHANPNISEYASAIVRKAMAKDRNDRYATAREFADDVEALLSGESPAFADALSPAPSLPVATEEPPPAPPPDKFASAERSHTKPAASARRSRTRARAKSPLSKGAIAGLSAGFLILVIIAACALWPESKPKPYPTVSKEAHAFTVTKKWAAEHPGRYAEAIARYDRLKAALPQPVYQRKIRQAMRSIKSARADAADKAFRGLKAKADKLKRSNAYTGAIAVYDTAPPELRGVLRYRIAQAVAGLNTEATAKIKLALDRAQALLDKGEPTAGMKELHKIAAVQHAALAAERRTLRDKLEQAGLTRALAARKRLSQLLHSMNAPAMKGDLRAAANVAIAAGRDPQLAHVQPSADALARIGAALLKAAKLPSRTLTPSTSDEHIAAAILALSAEDPGKMETAPQKAGDHEFRAHYATELRRLKDRLKERRADQQQRQQMRLAEFRATLAPLLKRR